MKNLYPKKSSLDHRNFSKMFIATTAILSLIVMVAWPVFAVPPAPMLLDPKIIPKYVNQLDAPPPVYVPEFSNATHEYYTVDVTEFYQQILPNIPGLGLLPTKVWGYGGLTGSGYFRNAPGPTFEATRNKQILVRYQNKLTGLSHLFAVDPTLHWANPNNIPMMDAIAEAIQIPSLAPPYPPGYNGAPYTIPGTVPPLVTNPKGWNAQWPVPLIPHLHGGEVQSTSDGHPEAWFTRAEASDSMVTHTIRSLQRGGTVLLYKLMKLYSIIQTSNRLQLYGTMTMLWA